MNAIVRLLFVFSLSGVMLGLNTANAVTLLFTSNIPDIFQDDDELGIAYLAGYIETLKKESGDEVIFIHGGNSLFPNALSVYDKGAHMIDILNVMETDVFMVNQREFAKGLDSLSLRTAEASFPMVLSNVRDMRTMDQVEGTFPYFVFENNDMTIGVMMVMSSTVNDRYLKGTAFVSNPLYEMQKLAKKLRLEGADKIIAVTENDVLSEYPISKMSSVDLVLLSYEGKDFVDFSKEPLFAKGGGNDGELIKVHLDSDNQFSTAEVVDYSNTAKSVKVSQVVESYLNRLSIVLDQEVGRILTPVNSFKTKIRSEENALGNLFADAIRRVRNTDLSIINSGSIRGNSEYEAGLVLTRKDIQKELPFGGRVSVVDITPSELKQVMEHSLSGLETLSGRFLQISGFEVVYNLSNPVGARVISIMTGGRPLNQDSYTLATDDFLKNGGDKYEVLRNKTAKPYASEDPHIWSAVIEFIEDRGDVSPTLDGRLTNIGLKVTH
ncbi:bifunctional metallophosphatase/5'-nucleotidase [Marinomonas sp. 2405UD68-3]|uniref:bifunctional metallophosphatase/5'-nucleotidase n=1 Tax=Marinomonas sp. 2405UD68-3 TaxID=3391835 RepID=UPI0039C9B1C9